MVGMVVFFLQLIQRPVHGYFNCGAYTDLCATIWPIKVIWSRREGRRARMVPILGLTAGTAGGGPLACEMVGRFWNGLGSQLWTRAFVRGTQFSLMNKFATHAL